MQITRLYEIKPDLLNSNLHCFFFLYQQIKYFVQHVFDSHTHTLKYIGTLKHAFFSSPDSRLFLQNIFDTSKSAFKQLT